jgi:hypothetical protein
MKHASVPIENVRLRMALPLRTIASVGECAGLKTIQHFVVRHVHAEDGDAETRRRGSGSY